MPAAGKPLGLHRDENRRASKPLMERRRRARINRSLADLQRLVVLKEGRPPQNTRHTKLEKADILEMTVTHLRNLPLQRTAPDAFRAGFRECAEEVSRFADRLDGPLVARLMAHLARVTPADEASSSSGSTPPSPSGSPAPSSGRSEPPPPERRSPCSEGSRSPPSGPLDLATRGPRSRAAGDPPKAVAADPVWRPW